MSGLTRRSIARMLGLAPVAAKAAADGVLKSAGVTVASGVPVPPMGTIGSASNAMPHGEWAAQQLSKFAKRKALASTVGIPENILSAMRENAKNAFALDIDLAAMVSMSPAAKIAHQRERNFQRQREQLLHGSPWMVLDLLTGQDEVWR